MKRKAFRVFIDILSYILGSAFNIALFVGTILLVITFTTKGFQFGKDFAKGETRKGDPKEVVIQIPDDSSPDEIAKILKDNELIDNEFLFKLQAKLNGTDVLFRSGTFVLNMAMTENELMDALQSAEYVQVAPDEKVMVPEGLTLKQIGQIFESKGFFTCEEFLAECEDIEKYDYPFISQIPEREFRLQGYLFPDTYFLTDKPTPAQVVKKMLDGFEQVFTYAYSQKAEELGMTMDEVLTLASIIEKEVRVPEERELASAVMHNRLKIDMRLQMCSTVLYALDKSRDRLLLSDLEVNSPYNTYVNSGLPPGPIACPGEASIRAVLYPEENCDYIYFVLKNPETGEHFFTADYNAFLDAKATYNDQF